MSMYLGDFPEDAEVVFCWNSNDADGASVTRSTDGTIKVRRDDGTDCTGTSVTDNEDTPDTGIHECKVDTSDSANFATGYDYVVWLDGAVIDSQTVNVALAHFSIENRYHPITEAQAGYLTRELTDAVLATAIWNAATASYGTAGTYGALLESGNVGGGNIVAVSVTNRVTANSDQIEGGDATDAIQAAADAALVANNLDHLCKTATGGADMTNEVADNTVLSRVLANGDTSAFVPSTDGLQPIRDQGDSAWITATGFSTHAAADVWSVVTREVTGGTVGTCTTNTDMRGTDGANTTVPDAAGTAAGLLSSLQTHGDSTWSTATGFSTLTAQQVWEYATRTLTAFGFSVTVGTNSDKTGYSLTAAYDDAKTAAQAGDAMTLADDAITSAKYDESTAYPVKSADTGATQIARTGADGDTLETLSDEIAAISAGDATLANQTTIISAVAVVDAIVDKLNTMLEADGAVYRFTTNALEQGPGGTTVTFTPVAVTVSAGAITDNSITQYRNAAFGPFVFTITDDDDEAVDLSASTLVFAVYDVGDSDTVLWSISGDDITVGGVSNNQVTVSDDDTNTTTAGTYRYVLWDTTNDYVRARGELVIVDEADSA